MSMLALAFLAAMRLRLNTARRASAGPAQAEGRGPRLDSRATLTGILFVLRTDIPWELLPVDMGCGSGMTCWRRLHEWHRAGIWERLHGVLLDRLGCANAINWERAAVDSAAVPARLVPA
ncbi:transposase [Azospirillum soli]|nr:transposase [Azospirillum soli]